MLNYLRQIKEKILENKICTPDSLKFQNTGQEVKTYLQESREYQFLMYILASFFFEKTIYMYLKLEIRFACKEFLAFKYVVKQNR